MEFGNILINLSLVLALAGIVTSILRLRTGQDRFQLFSRMISLILFISISAALLYLYMLFITSDLSVMYVWTYTDSSYSLTYKISGVLAGMDGSLLFWIWLIILPWFYEEMRAVKKPRDDDLMDWTRIFLFGVLALLLLILSIHEIFQLTPPEYLAFRPDGNGLNPILQTFLMAIHPPIVFVSYGFLALPFAAGLAYLVTGKKEWTDICINWGRIGWLFLTLGIGIGALWAYVVLGWGGYWGWDPVETSSLLPWILLTAFLHAQLMFRRKGEYKILAPVLGAFSFILVIFATFATRAGGLWVSVHTFGQADVSIDAWTRFTNILTTNDTVPYYFAMMMGMIILTFILVWYRQRRSEDREEKEYDLSELLNDDMLMLGTTFLLILITSVTMLILIRGINGLAPENFNGPVGLLMLVLILVMTMCISWRKLGRKLMAQIMLGTLVASLVSILMFSDDLIAAGSFPILIVSLILITNSILTRFNKNRPWQSLKVISAHLIHLAIVMLIIGYVASSFMYTEESITLEVGGASQEVFGYTFEAVALEDTMEFIYVDLDIYEGQEFVGRARPGVSFMDNQIRHEIDVKDTLTKDIYLIYNFDQDSYSHGVVNVEVKILPMMKFLWGGMWLMSIGMILRLITEIFSPKKSKTISEDEEQTTDDEEVDEAATLDEKVGEEGSEPVIKDDDYYESLLEAELNK